VVRATEASAVDCCKGPEPLRCSCRSPLGPPLAAVLPAVAALCPRPAAHFFSSHLYTLRALVRASHARWSSFGGGRIPQNYLVWKNLKIDSQPYYHPPHSHEAPSGSGGSPIAAEAEEVVGDPVVRPGKAAYPATISRTLQRVPCNGYPTGRYPLVQGTRPLWQVRVPCNGYPTKHLPAMVMLPTLRTLHRVPCNGYTIGHTPLPHGIAHRTTGHTPL
jgi:hypothetical protein